jgi:hypothetical protein
VSLPVFRDPAAEVLNAAPREPSGNLVVSDGVKRVFGAFGTNFRWRTEDLADRPDGYMITIWHTGREGQVRTDVTLRRLQNFKPQAGRTYAWAVRSLDASKVVSQGEAQLGQDGLLTLAGVTVPGTPARLVVVVKKSSASAAATGEAR